MSALHLACMEGHLSTVKVLAKCPAIDITQVDAQDRGCLEIAIENGHLAVLQSLLSLPFNRRPDIHRAAQSSGSTCLHVACANRRLDIIHFLVHDKGANTLARDNNGRTPDKVVKDPIVTMLVTGKSAELNGTSTHTVVPSPPTRSERNSFTSSGMMGPAPWADTSPKNPAPAHSAPSPSVDGGGVKSKFKNTPYVPPTNPTYLPPKSANASTVSPPVKSGAFLPTEKLVVNKLKVKDNWIKQDFEDELGAVTSDFIASLIVSDPADSKVGVSTHAPSAAVAPDCSPSRADEAHSDVSSSKSSAPNGAVATPETGGLLVKHTKKEPAPDDTAQLFEWVMHDDKIPYLEETLGITPHIKKDVQKIRQKESGATLLHVACRSGHLAVAQLLVEGVGADVNAVDNSGRTSLHCAVQASRVLIVRYLVKYCGADLDIKDTNGKTAMDMCTEVENPDSNSEEIARIISKAAGKSPTKRMKIVLPKYTGN